MARLPGIDYSKPVLSLGRADVYGPIRVATAEANALAKVGGAALALGEIEKGLQNDRGIVKFSEASEEATTLIALHKTRPPTGTSVDEMKEGLDEIQSRYITDEMGRWERKAFESSWDNFRSQNTENFIVRHVFAMNKEQRLLNAAHVQNLAETPGGMEAATLAIDGFEMLTPSEKAVMKAEATIAHEVANVERIISYGNADEILLFQKLYSAEEYQGEFGEAQRATALGWLDRAYKTRAAGELAFNEQEKARFAGDLELATSRGQPEGSPVNITRAFNLDQITGAKRTQLLRLWDKTQADKQDKAHAQALVSNSLAGGIPLDPKNTIHKDAVNNSYALAAVQITGQEGMVAANGTLNRQGRNALYQHGVNLAVRTNILPAQLTANLRTFAIAGTPNRVAELANIYRILERDAPQTLQGIGREQQAVYATVATMDRAGMPLIDAVEIARRNAKVNPEQRKVLSAQYQSQGTSVGERLKTAMSNSDLPTSGWRDWVPFMDDRVAPSPAIEATFGALEQEYFTLTNGDGDAAANLALRETQRIFAPSGINGESRMMAFSPEVWSGLNTEQLQGQLRSLAEDVGLEKEYEDGKFIIVPDAQTQVEATKTYGIYVKDDVGLPQTLINEEGMPIRFEPSVAKQRSEAIGEAREAHTLAEADRKERLAEHQLRLEQLKEFTVPLREKVKEKHRGDSIPPMK